MKMSNYSSLSLTNSRQTVIYDKYLGLNMGQDSSFEMHQNTWNLENRIWNDKGEFFWETLRFFIPDSLMNW